MNGVLKRNRNADSRLFRVAILLFALLFCAATLALALPSGGKPVTLTASDGATYEIAVTYDASAGIPAGASLEVSELTGERYRDYYERALAELGSADTMRAFDVRCLAPDGTEIEPSAPVKAAFRLPGNRETAERVRVLHFMDEGGVIAPPLSAPVDKADGYYSLDFVTDSFSVYALVGTALQRTLTASDNQEYQVTVTYDAASGIPQDAALSVCEIREGEEGYAEYVAKSAEKLLDAVQDVAFSRVFEITLQHPQSGEELQPDKDVKVSIELLNDSLQNYENVEVVHIGGEAEEDVEVVDSAIRGDAIEFAADGFSVYVLIGGDGQTLVPQCAYTFYVWSDDIDGYTEYLLTDGNGESVRAQTVKNAQELIIPQPVSTDSRVFAGWYEGYIVDGQVQLAESPYDFDNISITENKEIHLYAAYKNYAYAIFHDQYDSASKSFPIACTRRAELTEDGESRSASVKIDDISVTYNGGGDAKMAFFGWSRTPVATPGAGTNHKIETDSEGRVTITETAHFYPIFKNVRWLMYYAAQSGLSASYVAPNYYFADDNVPTPLPTTSRDGYIFQGWRTGTLSGSGENETVSYGAKIADANGNLVHTADDGGAYIYGGKLYLRSDVTLYAEWKAAYSIVYWKQKTTETPDTEDRTYAYAQTVTKEADIGATVSVQEADRDPNRYEGYTLDKYDSEITLDNVKDATVKHVLNVYYKLSSEYQESGETHALTFEDSVTGQGASEDLPRTVPDVAYGARLSAFLPENPASGRKSEHGKAIYTFSGWYLDPACTIPADFGDAAAPDEQFNGLTMPDAPLTLYAGWTPVKYRVQIDANYGALYAYDSNGKLQGTGATYFNNTYDEGAIAEYTHVTRNYVKSSSGTWFYVKHDLAYGGADRFTYYTQDIAESTEDTTFEYAPGTYSYAGWHEVYMDENGNETGEADSLYDFNQHTDHNMKLRLHWKKNGIYFLSYDAQNGALEDGITKEELLSESYSDNASIVLTRAATAPTGYAFIGWQARGENGGRLYAPGETFTLHADNAVRSNGKEIVYLDAVYEKVSVATVVYNANGGAVSASDVDFGAFPGTAGDEETPASGSVDTEAQTVTVSGLNNNSRFILSRGDGFSKSGFEIAGWSNQADYHPNDPGAQFYALGGIYGVDALEPTTLYAVWRTTVTYHLNQNDAEWGGEWDSATYAYDEETNAYVQAAYLNHPVSEPPYLPQYVGADGLMYRYWATSSDGDEGYDFTRPITGALDLYAYWSQPQTVALHVADASSPTLTENTGWTLQPIIVGTSDVALSAENAENYVSAPDGYAFAFAAAATDLSSVSEYNAVTAIKYDSAKKAVCVSYDGDSDFTALTGDEKIYFVYYQKKSLHISYKSMGPDGKLNNVNALSGNAVTTTNAPLGEYDMTEQLARPLDWTRGSGYTHYAFAIGAENAETANGLSMITDAVSADSAPPALRVRNAWRGFEYSKDNAPWVNCGYEPTLYVIYYDQIPAVVMFYETTVGSGAVMDTEFIYNYVVTETETEVTTEQRQTLEDGAWVNDGDPTVTEVPGETVTVYDTLASNTSYRLKNGEANSTILFYKETPVEETTSLELGGVRTVTKKVKVKAQTVKITQTPNEDFTVEVDGAAQNEYSYAAHGGGGTQSVTFTNTHKAFPLEIHVALVENDGATGGFIRRDTFRSDAAENYGFRLALGKSEDLLTKLPYADAFAGNADKYAFGAVIYGSGANEDGQVIDTRSMDVAAVAYERINESNRYELVLKDRQGNSIGELGGSQIYYLYYPMPRIQYVKESADGTLSKIYGASRNAITGAVEADNSAITYDYEALKMNGETVAQNQSFAIPLEGFVIGQTGNDFRMPPVLDDGLSERYLSYTKIGAGNADETNSSALDVSFSLVMRLAVRDNTLQYSFDGQTWKALPLSGAPTIYAIYTERGYDLQIRKTVDISKSGENALFTDSAFTVTLRSAAITKASYEAEGADGATISATPASASAPGAIVLTMKDGSSLKIKGLGRGDYTVTETGNENYELTAKAGGILSGSSGDMEVSDNSTVSLTLNAETAVELINSPKALCKIGDVTFYTLRSAIDYAESLPSYTATVEMLTDYLMPMEDTLVIPHEFNITLTTAGSGFSGSERLSVITRGPNLTDAPPFTNNGTLTLKNIVLDGLSVELPAPMIQSAGDLTIGAGATIRNAINSGYGGAVNATAGNLTVNSGNLIGNSASVGGAIYYAGNATITLSGTGALQNNAATTGDGGAIYAVGGIINVTGASSLSANKAENGRGGAIYAVNAVISVDQKGVISGNAAQRGGAIYVQTGAITVSETEGVTPPSVSGNAATGGDGGAIWLGAGSVTVSGGAASNNKAEQGKGGAIYAESATVALSDTAEMKSNASGDGGGAIYANSSAVTVSGGSLENNAANSGDGGAIYAGRGAVTVSGGVLENNLASSGDGGAIYAGGGNVILSGGSVSHNFAKQNGGAVRALDGNVTVSCDSLSDNSAADGRGGAICADSGSVTITTDVSGNSAGGDGGAVYANRGAVSITDHSMTNNASASGGGAIYAESGNVTLNKVSMSANAAGNGGAIYAGSGEISMSDSLNLTENAASQNGGAIYIDSGSAVFAASASMTKNAAVNGAAVFIASGRATFNGGAYTDNVASAGGAVGMGSVSARLTFSGDVKIKDNKLGSADSNIYLDQDSDETLIIAGLGSGAAIGVYVPNELTIERNAPGARFASYTSDANINNTTIKNDRVSFTIQKDQDTKKLFWGKAIKVEVRYLASYSGFPNGFPPTASGASKYTNNSYYPEFSSAAISELAAEMFNKYESSMGLTGSATYGGAYAENAGSFGDYITILAWDSDAEQWTITKRNGVTEPLSTRKIVIYYAEPAYLSIENNTNMTLDMDALTVNGLSVINSDAAAGYGMIFAKNGAIQSALLPVKAEDLNLAPGASINLLIPGGRNTPYELSGKFDAQSGVRLRRTGHDEESLTAAQAQDGFTLSGTTLNAGTYEIVFGDDKRVCKITDELTAEERAFPTISAAVKYAKDNGLTPATIEMLTDYLLPASDKVEIPQGYDITLTTAAKEDVTYPYLGDGDRATISRDSENKDSMINAWNGAVNGTAGTTLRIKNLIFDGKSVRGNSDGGAVRTKYCNVYVDNAEFYNVYAGNGGALYAVCHDGYPNTTPTVKDTILEVSNSRFVGCNSTRASQPRVGGGAIHTTLETLTVSKCEFEDCFASDQAGAVFHRVDGNYNSWATISDCNFTHCTAHAAGGLELDSKNIEVTRCKFLHCVATERNGGGFNVYALNSAGPGSDCWLTVTNCEFEDCHGTNLGGGDRFGGGLRSTSVYTKVENCSFTNTSSKIGGGIGISNASAKKAEIYGCSLDGCVASEYAGGIYCTALALIIGDSVDAEGNVVKSASIQNCAANKQGGGVYHNRDANNSSLTITNASIQNNVSTNSAGGGVYTNARAVSVSGSVISNNTSKEQGGGLYAKARTALTIKDSEISKNQSRTSDGGGVWYENSDDSGAYRNGMSLTLQGCTMDGNISGGKGGGVYTLAKTVTIEESTTISNCEAATHGGGVYQDRNADGASLTISDSAIRGCAAKNGYGGGVYAGVRTFDAANSEISGNTATNHGGGVWFDINDNNVRLQMKLTLQGCVINGNASGGNGGGVYTLAKVAEIKAYHAPGSDQPTPSVISNCTASLSGGGIYQNKDAVESSLTIDGSFITGCSANDSVSNNAEHGGGGAFAYVRTVTIKDSEISGNYAARNGGGVIAYSDGNDRTLLLDNSKLQNNVSGNQGGGLYSRSQLTIRNGVEITGNRLRNSVAANAAGAYLINNRTLTVGAADAANDASSVKGNYAANGAKSNLRLWSVNNDKENHSESVYVYCSLSGEIGVVNANKVGTWFGSSEIAKPNGFTDNDPVFKADNSTLHGIIDRMDPNGKKIIWAGPPIAKITDGEGNLLYLKNNATDPAIFDRLYEGAEGNYNTIGAFNMLNQDTPDLYTATGELYEGNAYCVKMLVESFQNNTDIHVMYVADRSLTFTTAGKDDADGYPYEKASGGRAKVIRGAVTGKGLLNVKGNLTLTNIVIDGGAENGENSIAPGANTRCMWIDNSDCAVTLGQDAILQNGRLNTGNDGGGAYINNGAFKIQGGVIRNCVARNGGGVYKQNGPQGVPTLTLTAGNIYQCKATEKGGGAYLNGGVFAMTGGSISDGTAKAGGGVFVGNNRAFQMSGGSIVRNQAETLGGGIAVGNAGAKLYFSGRINISGNTCDASAASGKACNVELNQNSKAVINTEGEGLLPGSYIGVYVPGAENTNSTYDNYGVERKPFGTFENDLSKKNLYSFVNDRNGLKGGIIDDPEPNTIYWIRIFSLRVSKSVESGHSSDVNANEEFKFIVNIRGRATSQGQDDAKDIDSANHDYGEMEFVSNWTDTTTATFTLKAGESVTAMNLSEGLDYEVIEDLNSLPAGRKEKYATMPSALDASWRAVYTGKIGENKDKPGIADPYTSVADFTNVLPVCKITDTSGNKNLLYRKYVWNGAEFYVPAVYTELSGDNGAFAALRQETFYSSNGDNPSSYAVSNGVEIQMLVQNYELTEPLTLSGAAQGAVTLTTATKNAAQFPYQGTGTTATIKRGANIDAEAFTGSMLTVEGNLTLDNIILDGAKERYAAESDGGVANVPSGGKLTIQNGATLKNSKTALNGGAIYVADGGALTVNDGGAIRENEAGQSGGAIYVAGGGAVSMTGGQIRKNESDGDGAGVYLEEGGKRSKLYLSGAVDFGGNGTDVGGNIIVSDGNYKTGSPGGSLTNGGPNKDYERARQDIYLAETDATVESIVLTGNLTGEAGSVWIWAQTEGHYKTTTPFAKISETISAVSDETYAIFRNAQTDDKTGATDNYLTGTTGDEASLVYWSGQLSTRRVILKKVLEDGDSYSVLSGMKFAILRRDLTELRSGLISSSSGPFWIGELPYGAYYLYETEVPDGHKKLPGDVNWFELIVSETEVRCTRLNAPPTP